MNAASEGLVVRVARKASESADICRLELVHPANGRLPAFTAGAHIDVQVPGGPRRQYSLCNDPQETHRYVIGVLRSPTSRGGSLAMHTRVREGDLITISPPRNHFPLLPAAHTLLVAGGIGITPMLSMAAHLAAVGSGFSLHYCATSNRRMAFLDTLGAKGIKEHVSLHPDDGAPDERLPVATALAPPQADARLYVCGPHGFMQWITDSASKLGWAPDRIHTEAFSPTQEALATDSKPFEVVLKTTGQVLTVPPGRSVASVLTEAGVNLTLSCEAGICGTCVTRVLEGTPDHRDQYLTEEEQARNDQFTPCCSRAISDRLVIDL
ncbi:MAG TPA: PDR/VanB family oxidoreductase [Hydrogenophaga sp.]